MLTAEEIVREFSKALALGHGSIFVGAGISTPEVPGWTDLLRGMARTRLKLKLNSNENLPLIAQYIVNRTQTRGPLIAHFREVLGRTYSSNSYHASLSRMNVHHLWTTNYDTLLEDAFKRHATVIVRASDESISRGSNAEIEIIKMHGCIQQSEGKDLVVTQEDYEDFFERRPATANRLKQDLLARQFLFIGYSCADQNIRNIIVEARRLGKRATQQHYIVVSRVKKDDSEERKALQARQDLWLDDLSRLGIAACQIDDFSELQLILDKIALKSRGNTVFVTGSHKRGEARKKNLRQLGALLAEQADLILLDGQSEGTGRHVISAFTEHCIRNRIDIKNRIKLFPNPYSANVLFSNDRNLLPILQNWRGPLMRSAQVVVVYEGGMGTEAEVQLAKDVGCHVVPVPESKTGLPSRLLTDSSVAARLQQADPEYAAKACLGSVSSQDVANCIGRILGGTCEA